MGVEDDEDMAFFPTMNEPREKKIKLITECLDILRGEYRLVMMKDHVAEAKRAELPASTISVVPEGARV
jgi:hypothetical protein